MSERQCYFESTYGLNQKRALTETLPCRRSSYTAICYRGIGSHPSRLKPSCAYDLAQTDVLCKDLVADSDFQGTAAFCTQRATVSLLLSSKDKLNQLTVSLISTRHILVTSPHYESLVRCNIPTTVETDNDSVFLLYQKGFHVICVAFVYWCVSIEPQDRSDQRNLFTMQ